MKRAVILGIGFAAALLGALIATTSCTQPVINCTSAYGPFAAAYTLTEGDPDSSCGQLAGDVLGLQTYFQPGGPNGTPDYEHAKLAIRPLSLGEAIAYAETRGVIGGDEVSGDANAIGWFSAGFPDSHDFCPVGDFDDAVVSVPEVPAIEDDPSTPDVDESQPAQSAIDVRYRWSDARLLVSADAQGTQFEADLEIEQDDCTAKYHVLGVYPVVACEDDAACEDEHNGINPDFAVRCDVELGLCVLRKELPAYEDAT